MQSEWILCPSKSFPGKFFYFNVRNGQAAWVPSTPEITARMPPETPKETYNHPERNGTPAPEPQDTPITRPDVTPALEPQETPITRPDVTPLSCIQQTLETRPEDNPFSSIHQTPQTRLSPFSSVPHTPATRQENNPFNFIRQTSEPRQENNPFCSTQQTPETRPEDNPFYSIPQTPETRPEDNPFCSIQQTRHENNPFCAIQQTPQTSPSPFSSVQQTPATRHEITPFNFIRQTSEPRQENNPLCSTQQTPRTRHEVNSFCSKQQTTETRPSSFSLTIQTPETRHEVTLLSSMRQTPETRHDITPIGSISVTPVTRHEDNPFRSIQQTPQTRSTPFNFIRQTPETRPKVTPFSPITHHLTADPIRQNISFSSAHATTSAFGQKAFFQGLQKQPYKLHELPEKLVDATKVPMHQRFVNFEAPTLTFSKVNKDNIKRLHQQFKLSKPINKSRVLADPRLVNNHGVSESKSSHTDLRRKSPDSKAPYFNLGPKTNEPFLNKLPLQANESVVNRLHVQTNGPVLNSLPLQTNELGLNGQTKANEPVLNGQALKENEPVLNSLPLQTNELGLNGQTKANEPVLNGQASKANEPVLNSLPLQTNELGLNGQTKANEPVLNGQASKANEPVLNSLPLQTNELGLNGQTKANEPVLNGQALKENEPVSNGQASKANEPVLNRLPLQTNEPVLNGQALKANEPVSNGQALKANERVLNGQASKANEPVLNRLPLQTNEPVSNGQALKANERVLNGQASKANEPVLNRLPLQTNGPVLNRLPLQTNEPVSNGQALKANERVLNGQASKANEPVLNRLPLQTNEPVLNRLPLQTNGPVLNRLPLQTNELGLNGQALKAKDPVVNGLPSNLPEKEINKPKSVLKGRVKSSKSCIKGDKDYNLADVCRRMLFDDDLRAALLAKRKSQDDSNTESQGSKPKTSKQETPMKTKKVTFKLDHESISMEKNEDMKCTFIELYRPMLQNLKGLGPSSSQDTWYIMADTELLTKEFQFIHDFVQIDPTCKLLIAPVVHSQLLALARDSACPLATAARNALRRTTSGHVVVQPCEDQDNTQCTNDTLLRCCVENMDQKKHVVLITNNMELYNSATTAHAIPCFTMYSIRNLFPLRYKNVTIIIKNDKDASENMENLKDTFKDFSLKNNNIPEITEENNKPKQTKNAKQKPHFLNNDPRVELRGCKESILDFCKERIKEPTTELETGKINTTFQCQKVVALENGRTLMTSQYDRKKCEDQNGKMNLPIIDGSKTNMASTSNGSNVLTPVIMKNQTDLKRFHVKNKDVEERLKSRIDEWLCFYTQMMEEALSNVLQKHTTPALKAPPWSLFEALQCIYTLHEGDKYVQKIVGFICSGLYEDLKMKKFIHPEEFMMALGCGVKLLECLKLNLPSVLEIQDCLTALLVLRYQIEDDADPTAGLQEPLLTYHLNSDTDEQDKRRNFVKDSSHVIDYLKKHFAAWKDYDSSQNIAESRTRGKKVIKVVTKAKRKNVKNVKTIARKGNNKNVARTTKTNNVGNRDKANDVNLYELEKDIGGRQENYDNKKKAAMDDKNKLGVNDIENKCKQAKDLKKTKTETRKSGRVHVKSKIDVKTASNNTIYNSTDKKDAQVNGNTAYQPDKCPNLTCNPKVTMKANLVKDHEGTVRITSVERLCYNHVTEDLSTRTKKHKESDDQVTKIKSDNNKLDNDLSSLLHNHKNDKNNNENDNNKNANADSGLGNEAPQMSSMVHSYMAEIEPHLQFILTKLNSPISTLREEWSVETVRKQAFEVDRMAYRMLAVLRRQLRASEERDHASNNAAVAEYLAKFNDQVKSIHEVFKLILAAPSSMQPVPS